MYYLCINYKLLTEIDNLAAEDGLEASGADAAVGPAEAAAARDALKVFARDVDLYVYIYIYYNSLYISQVYRFFYM